MKHPSIHKTKVYPVFKLKQKLGRKLVTTRLKLCMFWYVLFTGKIGGYYQGRALIKSEYYDFTLPYAYFVNLDEYKNKLMASPSNWSCSTGGDKNDKILLGDTTMINHFPHTKGNAVCVLSSFCNALFGIGY